MGESASFFPFTNHISAFVVEPVGLWAKLLGFVHKSTGLVCRAKKSRSGLWSKPLLCPHATINARG